MSFDSEAHYENIQDRKRIVELQSQLALAREGLEKIVHEIGVPQPGYPSPIANAFEIAQQTLAKLSETK